MVKKDRDISGKHVAVIGAGFTGLSAAYELERRGIRATVFEKTNQTGGMAGSFDVGGVPLERFYHHFFTSDSELIRIVEELGIGDRIVKRQARTGLYAGGNFFRLSSPMDVLRFRPLSLMNRIRLGLLVLKARSYKNWQDLDNLSAEEWIRSMCGDEVFRVVWQPLLAGKFGEYASEISAAWFRTKIITRGGSRDNRGAEQLLYLKGGFSVIAEHLAGNISDVFCDSPVIGIEVENGWVKAVRCGGEIVKCDAVIATPALPVIADILSPHVDSQFVDNLRRIEYLANVCLVLELDRKLSDLYWINVNDSSFPFVGIIEHTNFEPPESYSGRHIVYLSKYLRAESELYCLDNEALLKFALPHLQRIFPEFRDSWLKRYYVWRAEHAQPVVVKNFHRLIPGTETPVSGLYISTMAQIYPEDRGVNYAIRNGREIAGHVERSL